MLVGRRAIFKASMTIHKVLQTNKNLISCMFSGHIRMIQLYNKMTNVGQKEQKCELSS